MRGKQTLTAGVVLVVIGTLSVSYVDRGYFDDTTTFRSGMLFETADTVNPSPHSFFNKFGITGNETWEELSDSGTLLRYLAHQHFIKLNNNPGMDHNETKDAFNATSGELDDDLFYPLDCDSYDDDTQYPNALCIDGDNETCHHSVYGNEYYNKSCHSACSEGWGVPCGWEAVRHMRRVCNGTFAARIPSSSKNNAPAAVKMENLFIPSMETHFWACNVHAFCYSCVKEDKTVDDYCKAAVIRYNSLYAVVGTMNNMDDYWCDERILGHIENGTYCGFNAGKMKWCIDDGELA